MRQEVLMQELGVDEVYIDRLSGKNTDRPELKKMTDYVRKGRHRHCRIHQPLCPQHARSSGFGREAV